MGNVPLRKLREIRDNALEMAVREISVKHPRLMPYANYIIQNLEFSRIDKKIDKEYGKKTDYEIASGIAKSITSFNYMNKKAKEVVIKKGSSDYSLAERIRHPVLFIRRKSIDDTIDKITLASRDVIGTLKSSNRYKTLPEEVKKSLETIQQYGVKDIINDINSHYKLGKVDSLYRKGKTKKILQAEYKTVQEYADAPVKAAVITAILLMGGFLLGFSSSNLTGFVIAGNTISSSLPIALGFILLLAALFLSLGKIKNIKKQPKKQRKFSKIVLKKPSRIEFTE